ncbi:MAG: CpaF family protein [Acidimicrobiia bacterium]
MSVADNGQRRLVDAELDPLAGRLAREVAEELAAADGDVPSASSDPARQALAHKLIVGRIDRLSREFISQGRDLSEGDEEELTVRIRSHLFGQGELDRLVLDDSIENVFGNAWDDVWVRRADGSNEQIPPFVPNEEALNDLIRHTAARGERSERRFDRAQPSVSFPLADGSRFTAVRDLSGHTAFALRRHRHTDVDLDQLYRLGSIGRCLVALLAAAVHARFNLLIVGGTDAGKTTLLRALINAIDPDERLITVEDTLELQLSRHRDRHRNLLELECREQNIEGYGEVTMRYLTRLALRLSPDRLIVGESRGPEILDMFQAMSQGNDGSMGTLHARSSADAFVQITRYALKAPEHLTPEAVAVDIAASLDWVLHIHKLSSGRRVVSSLREITGHDGTQVLSNEVFAPDEHRRAVFRTPLQDRSLDRLVDAGFDAALLELPGGGWTW